MILQNDLETIANGLDWEDYPSFSKSIEDNLYIPTKGYYSLWKTPFFRFILDLMEDKEVEVIGLMIPSQIGKSQLLTGICLEYARRYAGNLILYYCPDQKLATELASEKLIPSVNDSSTYSSLINKCANGSIDRSSFTNTSVSFYNGSEIRVLGAGGKTALVSKTSPLVILDEYARMKSLSKNAGDVLSMAITRTTTMSYGNRKVIAASTPLEPNETIHKLHQESRQYTWEVPCPNCGTYQFLAFENLKWDKPDDEGLDDIRFADRMKSGSIDVYYKCPHCSHKIYEKDKLLTLNKGRMVCSGNADLSNKQISIHLNGLYNLVKWNDLAARFIVAKNNPIKMQEFKNQVLAAPWEETAKTRKLKIESIAVSDYNKGQLPTDTYKIIAGIDVQDNRFYSVVLAITWDKKIYVVDWEMPSFNLEDPYNPDSYPFLLESRYYDGQEIEMMALDTGDNTSVTYALSQTLNRCQPIKGYPKSRYGNQLSFKSTKQNLLLVHLQETNDFLENLILQKRFLIPADMTENDDYLKHLANVVKRNGKYVDRHEKARTDYRDATRYALALIDYIKVFDEIDGEILEKERAKSREEQEKNAINALTSFFG